MAPAPIMPKRNFLLIFLAGELNNGIVNRFRHKLDVLRFVVLVPGKHQDIAQSFISAWKAALAVVKDISASQVKRKATLTQCFLLPKDSATEGRLLNVPGSTRNITFLQRGSQRIASAGDPAAVHAQT